LHTPDVTPDAAAVLDELIGLGDRSRIDGMSRYGIRVDNAIGVSLPKIRQLARRVGQNHELAAALWASGIHEARILAGLVDEPEAVTPEQMDSWVAALDSWDVCDQTMSNLFSKTRFAHERALEWSRRSDEFGKRAGFSLMAALAVRDKAASDASFSQFFVAIERESDDNRNYVRKAVNWALRQIGKRNAALRDEALATALRIRARDTPTARWIAANAIRDLSNR
jgi:3-methyladenine DNA glycosylase AlkD